MARGWARRPDTDGEKEVGTYGRAGGIIPDGSPCLIVVEQFADFLEEGLGLGMDVLAGDLGELFEQVFLFIAQAGGDLDKGADVKVAMPPSVKGRHPFCPEAEDFSGLCSRRDFHLDRFFGRGHFDLVAEGGLGKAQGQLDQQVGAVADENGMVLDRDHDVEVTGNPTGLAEFAFAPEPEPVPGVDTGGYFYGELFFFLDQAAAAALRAGGEDDPSGAAASVAGARDAEEPLLKSGLAPSVAGRTDSGAGPGLGAASATVFAGDVSGDVKCFLRPLV